MRKIGTEKAVQFAISNVLKEGLNDIFPRPFEVEHLKNEHFRKVVHDTCLRRIRSNSLEGLELRPIQHVLFPKKEPFDFRRAALIDPLDTITTLSIAISLASECEGFRPSKRNNKVFSYRFKPKNGLLFDEKYNYTSFEKHVSKKVRSSRTKVLVKCDIASFYDRLNLHRLESTLAGLGLDEQNVKLTNEALLFWARRDSYGLPIGGNASRILAEAALISIDDFLIANNIQYCRFVDDFRFFAPSLELAHSWLNLFVARLFQEGLTINPSKTSLEDVSDRARELTKQKYEINTTKKQNESVKPIRLIAGYSGLIPTKFRKLSEREISELEKANYAKEFDEISSGSIVEPKKLSRIFKILTAQKKFSEIPKLLLLVNKFPQFTPLMSDLLIKNSNQIDNSVKKKVIEHFSNKLKQPESHPEYILISIVTLLGSTGFEARGELMSLFRLLRRNSGAFIGRALIEALDNICTRTDALEVRGYFDRADAWEKRAITRLVDNHLPEQEKRPWLKNVKLHQKLDIFAVEDFAPKKPKRQTKRTQKKA
jgi:hypothetical protein